MNEMIKLLAKEEIGVDRLGRVVIKNKKLLDIIDGASANAQDSLAEATYNPDCKYPKTINISCPPQ